ncbi:MAG: DUF3450 family protein [Phycisphaeraceae bacterium]
MLLPVLIGAAVAVGSLGVGAASQAEPVAPIDDTRARLEKWVQTRQLISQEERDWKLGREMLSERIALVEREIASIRERIGDAEQSITEADRKRDGLVAENEALKRGSQALVEALSALEQRTRGLLQRVPTPVRDTVQPLSQQLPDDKAETKLSLAARFQNVIGILNEIDKFNGEVTLTSEVRELPDGSSAEVTAMYVGLGRAYYAGAGDALAGHSTATKEGWEWTQANEIAPAVSRAIDIVNNEAVASFVRLPVKIEKP